IDEAVIGDELLLTFPNTNTQLAQFRSLGGSLLTCFSLFNVNFSYQDTFFTWVSLGQLRINAFHYSPGSYYRYGDKDYYSFLTSFDSLHTASASTFHRSMIWADSLGIVELNYYRVSKLLADTVEHIHMKRVFK